MARLQTPGIAMGATGGSVRDRVHRLLGLGGGHQTRRFAAFGGIAIALALLSIALVRLGAQADRPRFEVASIKPAAEGGRGFGGPLVYPGGVVRHQRVPLFFLIAVAYDVPVNRIDGKSDVMNERYAIEAKADAGALPAPGSTIKSTIEAQVSVIREMLKTLLAERFKLAIHVEKRDTPIYALVVNGTPKLTPAARNCEPTTMAEYESGKGPCGLQGGGPANGYHIHGSEISNLAGGLSNFVGRPIIDRTGITGRFDIDVPPWSTGAPPRPDSDEPQPDPDGPSIFAVLQQMGLRLEPSRAPIDYYVVDHVERPSPN